ncbi:hypothetical protein [Lysobacter sp. TAB13]|uniref:hypothetical protein n=1 Tax=Lysobacter sp. TAB13 TaxID=3233065 RepID=UPI003F954FA5
MILWGASKQVLDFDLSEREYCQQCRQDQDFGLRLKYEHGHFYHLFGWVMSKQYQLVCPDCTHGWVVNPRAAEALIGRNPIPFYQRHGWLVMLALAAIIGVAALAHQPAG